MGGMLVLACSSSSFTPTARRLRPHEYLPEAQTWQHQLALVHHHVARQLAPTSQAFDARWRRSRELANRYARRYRPW